MNLGFRLGSGMTRVNARRQKFGLGTLIFMMLFGLVFGGAGLLIIKSTQINKSWTHVQGSIVRSQVSIDHDANSGSSTLYTPIISYSVDGKSYEVSGSSSSSFQPAIGEQREVAYDPQNPADAKAVSTASDNVLMYIFPLIGLIIIVISPFLYLRSRRRTKDINNLMQNGQKVQGVLVDIQSGAVQQQGGAASYRIVVAATAPDGTAHNYVSDYVTGFGSLALTYLHNSPIPIDVYINSTNADDYYVDITELPNITPERITELLASVGRSATQPSVPNMAPNPTVPTFAAPTMATGVTPVQPTTASMPQPEAPIGPQPPSA